MPKTEPIDQADLENVPFQRDDPGWKQDIIHLIERGDEAELKASLPDMYAADLADLIQDLETEQGLFALQCLDYEARGDVLHEMEEHVRERYLELLSPGEVANIIQAVESDEAHEIINEVPPEKIGEVLSEIPVEDRVSVTELLSYPEGTAGAIMAKEFAAVREKETVKSAIKTLRKLSGKVEDIYTVYVLDEDGRYQGHIDLDKLILSSPRSRIKRLMETELLAIPVDTDQEEVANYFARYNFVTAPVVDPRGFMLGRITADDIFDVMQEEATEDILRLGGVSKSETMLTPFWLSSLKRIAWLSVNLLTAFLSASVVRLFETTIAQAVILASLMPIVAGMGGNAAGQTVATVIRNIALGELPESGFSRAVFREWLFGVMNGISIGLLTGAIVYFIVGIPVLSAVITTALLFNMMVAALAGALVPLLLRRFGVDPAIASTIFVTTCTDMMGFFFFLGLAFLTLPYLK